MIKIYTISSCTSCKKAKTWLNAHQLPYKEQNLGKEPLTKQEILDILSKTEDGIESIVSSKNRYAKALNCNIEDLSLSQVIDLIQENPRILKSPILIDDKRLQVGYKEDDIHLSCHALFVTLKILRLACELLYNMRSPCWLLIFLSTFSFQLVKKLEISYNKVY